MPGPRRRDRRTASSRDPVKVRRLLQRDADAFIAVERRTEASDCAAAESGQGGEGAARRWAASRIPAAGGMRPIGRISGRHTQGFSREDVIMGTLGATTAALVSAAHVDDLVGFRASHVPGGTYSNDVYSADLKLAGVARRLGLDIGPARFLLFSGTYSAKGYRVTNATPADKQRLVGFEIGLNLEEMLNAVNARRDTWWGYALHVVGDNIRIPYTAVGMRYDLNHDQWRGPNNGNFP